MHSGKEESDEQKLELAKGPPGACSGFLSKVTERKHSSHVGDDTGDPTCQSESNERLL